MCSTSLAYKYTSPSGVTALRRKFTDMEISVRTFQHFFSSGYHRAPGFPHEVATSRLLVPLL